MIEKIFSPDVLALSAVSIVVLTIRYFVDKKMELKLGKIYAEFERGRNNKWYRYRNFWFGGLIIVQAIVLYFLPTLFSEPGEQTRSNPLFVPIMILTMNYIYKYRPFTIAENGFTDGAHFFAWKDIRGIEWDRDVKQIEWGFKIYFSTKAAPFKGNLSREFVPEAQELFKKFLKTEKEPEKVLI